MLLLAELKTFFQTYSLFIYNSNSYPNSLHYFAKGCILDVMLDPSCDSWCALVMKPNFSLTFKNGIGGNDHKFFWNENRKKCLY